MSCYFVARITINDPEEYQRYLAGFDEVFAPYSGNVVAVDEAPRLLEGEWRHSRLVLIRFADEAEARRWYDSPEYRQLVTHRHRAAEADIVLVTGRD